MNNIEKLISSIRNSHPDMVELYTEGQCYNFHLILRSVYPDAVAWYDYIEGHVYSKIGNYWYDIRGKHYRLGKVSSILSHSDGHKPHRWGKSETRRLLETAKIITINSRCPIMQHLIHQTVRQYDFGHGR